jgi:hypothetical protein
VILRDVHDDATFGIDRGVHTPADCALFRFTEAGRQASERRRRRVCRTQDQLAIRFPHLERNPAAVVRARVRVVVELDFLEFMSRLRHQQARGLSQMSIQQCINAPMRVAIRQRG